MKQAPPDNSQGAGWRFARRCREIERTQVVERRHSLRLTHSHFFTHCITYIFSRGDETFRVLQTDIDGTEFFFGNLSLTVIHPNFSFLATNKRHSKLLPDILFPIFCFSICLALKRGSCYQCYSWIYSDLKTNNIQQVREKRIQIVITWTKTYKFIKSKKHTQGNIHISVTNN